MTKLRNAVLGFAAVMLATGAAAQAGFKQDNEAVTVAEELFGPGTAVELDFEDYDEDTGFTPKAKLIFTGATSIGANTEFTVTYTLHRAVLDQAVGSQHFKWGTWGPKAAQGGDDCDTGTTDDNGSDADLQFCAVDTEVNIERSGGRRDDNSVSFEVTIPTAITGIADPTLNDQDDTDPTNDAYEGTTRKIVFFVPDVEASGLSSPTMTNLVGNAVMVDIDIEQSKRNTGDTGIDESIMGGNTCGTMTSMVATAQVACPVVMTHKVITDITNTSANGTIDLDDRTSLAPVAKTPTERVALSTIKVDADFGSGGVRNDDGDVLTEEDGFVDSLAGTLAITVASEHFNDGDVVYIDANADKTADASEMFSISGNTASDSVDLSGSAYTVYYVPGGETNLMHRTKFAINASTEFSESGNKNVSAKAASAELRLSGIPGDGAKAYAIAPTTSSDVANVRVTCESAIEAGCRVFFECRDQAGMSTFGEAGSTIGPNQTMRWNQMEIQDALGLDGSWDGRLSCQVLSDRGISVQVLTRAEGVLVNNTSVNEG